MEELHSPCAHNSSGNDSFSKKNDIRNLNLTDYSSKDAPWDTHRSQTDDAAMLYASERQFKRYAERMNECSGVLHFGWDTDQSTGESQLRLRKAQFCRVRYCVTCQWRRSLMWQARFYQSLPDLVQVNPKARWIFLTLTVRNCPISDLRSTIQHMNKSWQRLKDRKEFKSVLGWIRTTEVTRGQDGTAHPHFHALLMVQPSYFKGGNYIKQARWVELWADCLRVNYLPNVDVRVVKSRAPKTGETPVDSRAAELQGAVAEILKYSTKPDDLLADQSWFLELTKQTHKLRFLATGGALKHVLKVDQESDQDLVNPDGDSDVGNEPLLGFGWNPSVRRYKRSKKFDIFY